MRKTLCALLAGWGAVFGGAAAEPFEAPFYIYRDNDAHENHGAPSGWWGDFRDLMIDMKSKESPKEGSTCIKITYSAQGSKHADWAGMIWQHPPNNGGDLDGGIDFTGATKLTFWARGENGGEVIDAFKFGGTLGAYPDSDTTGISEIILKREWTKYEIDLGESDIFYISGLFVWVASRHRNPHGFVIYLDEIKVD